MLRPSQRALARRLRTYCRTRLATLSEGDRDRLERYLVQLVSEGSRTPMRGRGVAWAGVADASGIPEAVLRGHSRQIRPALDAITRATPHPLRLAWSGRPGRPKLPAVAAEGPSSSLVERRPPGRKHRPVEEFPAAPAGPWEDVAAFGAALDLHMRRHGDSAGSLHRAIVSPAEAFDETTLKSWRRGQREPRTAESLAVLKRIERRYRLPAGYFATKLGNLSRAVGCGLSNVKASERRRLAWHLPNDFSARPAAEQAEILTWVRTVVLSGGTEYRRYQSEASKDRFGLRFRGLAAHPARAPSSASKCSALDAPPELHAEMAGLLAFKTAPLTPLGYQRNGVWGPDTAAQKVEHLSLLFGALAASPESLVQGRGVDPNALSFAALGFPSVWDWYLRWRHQRRGFYTAWEVDMLMVVMSLVRKDFGWIRQTPSLSESLVPIPGLISEQDIEAAQRGWNATCDRMHDYARATSKEIKKISRVHRDPFEPILVVLESESPLREYLKIADEILRLMPNERRYPKAAAESCRAFLMIRLGLHLGVRQKNLRQLLVCPKGSLPRTERALADLKRGELRWSEKDDAWEIFIPSVAFKNADSSFFGGKPFRLRLPDLGALYEHLERYIDRHRTRLLAGAADPGTLFVKSASTRTRDPSYDQTTFYEAWRLIIQRYGVFNPYTGRGAIAGLLPHGPHNVRDVLATHVLKRTGSYQQASYAIQDTPEMVAKHYGRFLPEDKAAMAAQILNEVWTTAA